MEPRRATLWCKIQEQFVEVCIGHAYRTQPPVPLLPTGWMVCECLGRAAACFGQGCPFTTDGGASPFGEAGETAEGRPERVDPTAEPSFEGEWE